MFLDALNVQQDFSVLREPINVLNARKVCTKMNQGKDFANLVQKVRLPAKVVVNLLANACQFVVMELTAHQALFLVWNARETLLVECLQSMASKSVSTAHLNTTPSSPGHKMWHNVGKCVHLVHILTQDSCHVLHAQLTSSNHCPDKDRVTNVILQKKH
jgi:hypothetical protein